MANNSAVIPPPPPGFTDDVSSENSIPPPPEGFTEDVASQPEMGLQNATLGQKATIFGKALGEVSKLQPTSMIQSGLNKVGDWIAEKGGETGMNPYLAAGIGTVVSKFPAFLSAGVGLKSMFSSQEPLAQGIRKTPQEVGQEMNAGEQQAGISSRLPELKGSKTIFPQPEIAPANYENLEPSDFPKPSRPLIPAETLPSVTPKSYPRDPNTFINSARERVDKFGSSLSPQEVSDYKRQLSTWLNDGTIQPKTPVGAIATQLRQDVTDLHNSMVPGREQLNSVYGISKMLHPDIVQPLKDYAAKYGKRALAEAIAIAVGGAAASKFYHR